MIVAFLGLPGVGKTTLASALAQLLDGKALLEPGEDRWPDYVRRPHPDGDFTRLSWFRTQRVPLYHRAAQLRSQGAIAVLDSYYDKWCVGWLGRPGLEWLISLGDPYFAAARAVAEVDAQLLPAADVVVVLEIDDDHWRSQLAERGRMIDRDQAFLSSHHTQSYFIETASERAAQDGTTLIRHMRQPIAAAVEAEAIAEKLRAHRAELR